MKNLSKIIRIGALALVLMLTVAVAGCKPKVDLDALVKDAYKNELDIKQQTLKANLTGAVNVEADKGDTDDTTDDVDPTNVDFNLNMNGYFAQEEDFTPAVDMTMDGDFKVEEPDQSLAGKVAFDLKVIDKVLYLNVKQIPEAALGDAAGFVQGFIGKWWKFVLPAEIFAELPTSENKEQVEKMRELLETATILSGLKNVGIESVNGVDAYHLKAKLDKVGTMAYLEAVAKLTETEFTDEDKDSLGKTLTLLEGKPFEVWISEKDHNFVAIAWDFSSSFADLEKAFKPETEGQEAEQELPKGKISLKLRVDQLDFNKAKTLDVPADATEFDLSQFIPTPAGASLTPAL